jgi:hypothetical protein
MLNAAEIRARLEQLRHQRQVLQAAGWGDTPALDESIDALRAELVDQVVVTSEVAAAEGVDVVGAAAAHGAP